MFQEKVYLCIYWQHQYQGSTIEPWFICNMCNQISLRSWSSSFASSEKVHTFWIVYWTEIFLLRASHFAFQIDKLWRIKKKLFSIFYFMTTICIPDIGDESHPNMWILPNSRGLSKHYEWTSKTLVSSVIAIRSSV